MTLLSLPTSLPGPCPVCGETVDDIDERVVLEHQGHVDGYNRATADVVAYLCAVVGNGHLSSAIERGDAFGAGRR